MGPWLGRESKVLKNCRREPCEDVRVCFAGKDGDLEDWVEAPGRLRFW